MPNERPRQPIEGLSSAVASERLKELGPNSTPDTSDRILRRAMGKFWAPVPWLLEVVIVVELFLHNYVEATIIAFLVVFNATISFLQEGRARKTLALLKSRLALSASVRRDGAWRIVPTEELVEGDVIKLSLGRIVPADVQLLEGSVLIDQSMITGESIPIELPPGGRTFAGALVRRGEAVAKVIATGVRTKFGHAAELVRTAHVKSTQQKVVFKVVRNLALFNSALIVLMLTYGFVQGMAFNDLVPLFLTAVLTSIPVALPANFTLAAAIGARTLAKLGVLPTRLSAVDEAASMDVLCSDKTGTLTQNELTVKRIVPAGGFSESQVLNLAALASSDGGQDTVDLAIRSAATNVAVANHEFDLVQFIPFDPATKMAEAHITDSSGREFRIAKGAFSTLGVLAVATPEVSKQALALESDGYRVLAVAFGPADRIQIAGFIALGDPPRTDSAGFINELRTLGVRTVMVTGDARATAAIVAREIGLQGEIYPDSKIPDRLDPKMYSIFARILPEDKFQIVKAFQSAGHVVGMCGDGVNDAPALRLAQMGTAVSTATDVAKSAAGIVLTEAGLGGIVTSVKEGRKVYQRILTYTLRSVTHKFRGALFLALGLFMTGKAILTPSLLVISMVTGDFLSLLSATDNVRMSPKPNAWHIGRLTAAGIALGFCDLVFCVVILGVGQHRWKLDIDHLRSLSILTLIYSGQAIQYVVRERRHLWSSRPSLWLMLGSTADVLIISILVTFGIFMRPLPPPITFAVLTSVVGFAFVLDFIKIRLFRRLGIE